MTLTIGTRPSSQVSLDETAPVQNVHPGTSFHRPIGRHSRFRPASPEDQIVFRRWRLGFFAFYSAVALLLGGVSVIAERSGTVTTATARLSPTMASTYMGGNAN